MSRAVTSRSRPNLRAASRRPASARLVLPPLGPTRRFVMAKRDNRKQAKKAPHEYDVPDDVKDKAWSEADTDKHLWAGAYGHKFHPVRIWNASCGVISVSWRSPEVKPRGKSGITSWATVKSSSKFVVELGSLHDDVRSIFDGFHLELDIMRDPLQRAAVRVAVDMAMEEPNAVAIITAKVRSVEALAEEFHGGIAGTRAQQRLALIFWCIVDILPPNKQIFVQELMANGALNRLVAEGHMPVPLRAHYKLHATGVGSTFDHEGVNLNAPESRLVVALIDSKTSICRHLTKARVQGAQGTKNLGKKKGKKAAPGASTSTRSRYASALELTHPRAVATLSPPPPPPLRVSWHRTRAEREAAKCRRFDRHISITRKQWRVLKLNPKKASLVLVDVWPLLHKIDHILLPGDLVLSMGRDVSKGGGCRKIDIRGQEYGPGKLAGPLPSMSIVRAAYLTKMASKTAMPMISFK